jgi:hypothetical protein
MPLQFDDALHILLSDTVLAMTEGERIKSSQSHPTQALVSTITPMLESALTLVSTQMQATKEQTRSDMLEIYQLSQQTTKRL